MSDIVVLGSFMMDLVTKTERLPENGETLVGTSFIQNAGGKGANQAATIAKLGKPVKFIGMVGNDDFGKEAKEVLISAGVQIGHLEETDLASTGIGNVMVGKDGSNRIIIIPGANLKYSAKEFETVKELIKAAKLLVMQLEMDFELTKLAINFAHENGVEILLNPAPARELPIELLSKVSYLTPNETELGIVTNRTISTTEEAVAAAQILVEKGVDNVIVTLGEKGAVWVDNGNNIVKMKALTVDAVDTVAAGDSFNGALACGIIDGLEKNDILKMANQVGALTVTKVGAIQALPTYEELYEFQQVMEATNV
ncbi:ribokinase [Enterococcus devriesei]|uniref:ribokinase n=1 Tax=Enterococcus devriesei TaxID=319970 RepID=UPI001C0FE416|nr:ribokinase [Enterococcus devriesei]MBU5365499.1 ribokinase [Enterococcus devriesei]